MEPLKNLLTIYEDKESILKYFLPLSSTKHLDEYEYIHDLDTLFLNDRIICINKSTGEYYKKGYIIKITEDKIMIKVMNSYQNITLIKDKYYIFRYLRKNKSKKNNRMYYEELLKSLG
tara:strand:- start:842 stop:1195 length:354 start_codon:yes stop_codon:yes gene_type:complete